MHVLPPTRTSNWLSIAAARSHAEDGGTRSGEGDDHGRLPHRAGATRGVGQPALQVGDETLLVPLCVPMNPNSTESPAFSEPL